MQLSQNCNSREILSAGRDCVALGVGAMPNNPHPLAADLTLSNLAYAAGLAIRPQRQNETDSAVRARGIASSDLSKILAEGVGSLVQRIYSAQAEHLKFCLIVPVKYLNTPTSFPAIDGDLELEPLAEGSEIRHRPAFATTGASDAILTTFSKTVFVSRQLIINDSFGEISRIFGGLGSSAGRVESRIVTKVLESPLDLDDEAPVFSVDSGNVIVDAGLTESTLGASMALLRNQITASGNRADLALRHLVVSSPLEVAARKLVFSLGLPNVEITVLANLPNGRWYALADPQIQPVVGVLRLAGSKSPVLVEQGRNDFSFDGTPVAVTADLGATLLSRVGIVRGGVVV